MALTRLHALVLAGVFCFPIAGCDLEKGEVSTPAPTDSSVISTGNTIGFRITPQAARQVLAESDSVKGSVFAPNGEVHRFAFPADSVLGLDGMIRLPGIPARDCRVELVFVDDQGKARLKLVLQVVVASADQDTGVATTIPPPAVAGIPVVVLPVGDASWEPDVPYNLGASSGLRIVNQQSLAVIDFGRIDSLFSGRKILRARLLVDGFSSHSAPPTIRIAVGTIPRGWQEGNGHWYWFDNLPHNGYDVAYQYWPEFVPPAGATNPSSATGIRADRNPEIGPGWKPIDTIVWEGTLTSAPSYPARDLLSPAEFDLTEAVRAMVASGQSQAFAIRAIDNMSPGHMQLMSKEHQDGAVIGPRLVVELAPDSVSGDMEFHPLGDTWIDSSDRNTGLGSGAMLWRNGDMVLFDFGNLPAALAGKGAIASADLVLVGWSGPKGTSDGSEGLEVEYGTIPLGWSEGRGHWYWFNGRGYNGYDSVYRLWPEYVPPPSAVSPSLDGGVHWSIAQDIRDGFVVAGKFDAELARGPIGIYPTREQSTVVTLDVTAALRNQVATGQARGFALRRLVSATSPQTNLGFFTKDMAPSVAPVLRVRFAR